MTYKTTFTKTKKASPEFRLVGTSMYANIYPENMLQERDFVRKDGTTWTRKAMYAINLIPNKASLDRLEKLGMQRNLKEPSDRQKESGFTAPFIEFTRMTSLPDGTKLKPPIVEDGFGEPMNDFVGNGSEVEIVFSKKEASDPEKYPPNLYLKKVVVRNLVKWEPSDTVKKEETKKEPTPKKKEQPEPVFDDAAGEVF